MHIKKLFVTAGFIVSALNVDKIQAMQSPQEILKPIQLHPDQILSYAATFSIKPVAPEDLSDQLKALNATIFTFGPSKGFESFKGCRPIMCATFYTENRIELRFITEDNGYIQVWGLLLPEKIKKPATKRKRDDDNSDSEATYI